MLSGLINSGHDSLKKLISSASAVEKARELSKPPPSRLVCNLDGVKFTSDISSPAKTTGLVNQLGLISGEVKLIERCSPIGSGNAQSDLFQRGKQRSACAEGITSRKRLEFTCSGFSSRRQVAVDVFVDLQESPTMVALEGVHGVTGQRSGAASPNTDLSQSKLGLNQTFESGRTLLHEACVSQNLDAVVYLTAEGADTTIRDKTGKMPENLCFSPKIQSLVAGGDGVTMVTDRMTFNARMAPSLHDKQLIFDLIHNIRDIDDLLIKLQKYDFNVNTEADENGDYLIHSASREGVSHIPMIGLLLKISYANIDLVNKSGHTPLMIATEAGDPVLVESLLCVFGANPNVVGPPGGWTGGWTALHHASYHNHDHIASMLIKRGADFNMEDNHGARPDDIASISASIASKEVIQMSRVSRITQLSDSVKRDDLTPSDLRETDLFVTDADGFTLLHNAARYNACGSLNVLLSYTTAPINAQHEKNLQTALSMAAAAGHSEIIRILMRHDASPLIRDISGNFPLHLAIINQKPAAVETILLYSPALTGLQKGIELVLGQPEVHRMLRVAVQRRQRELVMPALYECSMSGNADKLFCSLEPGDSVNTVSGVGDWPLYVAVENGHKDVTSLLLQWGGDLLRKHPSNGNSVLHVAAGRGHESMVTLLLDSCEKCYSNRASGAPAESISNYRDEAGCTEMEAYINSFNFQSKTPLMLAAEKGYIRIVQNLLARGASTAVLDPYSQCLYKCDQFEGVQFLLETYRKRHSDGIFQALSKRQAIKILEKIFLPKFDHNLRNPRSDTPLMAAAALGKPEVVRWLIKSAVYSMESTPSTTDSLTSSTDESDIDSGAVLDMTNGTNSHPVQTSSQHGDAAVAGEVAKVTRQVMPHDLPDDEELEGNAYHEHISSLLDSMNSCKCASVYLNDKDISHLCAVNVKDGRTAYHRAVESGDKTALMEVLLEADNSAINIQDNCGLSPLHLACQLGRKKILEKLVNLNYVDLNCRTLDGTLPEEMTKNKSLSQMVKRARQLQPTSGKCPFRSIPSSLFGSDHHTFQEDSHIDFDQINTRFAMMKQQVPMGEFDAYL